MIIAQKSQHRKGIFVLIGLFFIFVSFTLANYLVLNDSSIQSSSLDIKTSANDDSTLMLEFWENEIARVNNTPLNIEYGKNDTLEVQSIYADEEFEFQTQEISFDSPNWVGEKEGTIRLKGYVLYPEKIKAINPGCLCMHGLNGQAETAFSLAIPYLEKGFVVLCHSHPGHGDSEGAHPEPSNFYYEGQFNKSAHNYLTICGAIQGLRVLENMTLVNNSEIMVTGGSYGGLNTMWLSSICGERIQGAAPYIAVGDLEKVKNYPTSLLWWVWDTFPSDMPQSFWEEQLVTFDPKYYIGSPKLPPIMWQVGTNDEFFPYTSINGTLDAVQNQNNAFLQIYANEHHGFNGNENTTKFFIDYILENNTSPPQIDVNKHKKGTSLFGDTLSVSMSADSDKKIEKVQLVYKYIDIVGATWLTQDLSKEGDEWTGIINPAVITSGVDYYFIVILEGEEQVWFSSKIYTPGLLNSNMTIPFYLGISFLIGLPAALIIKKRYDKEIKPLPEQKQDKAKKNLILELIAIGILEVVFFVSLILPWAYGSGISWTHLYFFNNLFTWKMVFGDFAFMIHYLTAIFLIAWVIYSLLSTSKPLISAFLKVWYVLFVFGLYGILAATISGNEPGMVTAGFGTPMISIGPFVMLFSIIGLAMVGVFKMKYQTKFGIRQVKGKKHNIDYWFKFGKTIIRDK